MLITAQRVRSARRTGINTFLFHHGVEESAKINWDAIDVDAVVETHPGYLVAETIEVIPGGNSVDSFLDILAPDGTSKDILLGLLGHATELVGREHERAQVVRGKVVARLSAERVPYPERVGEFRALRDRVAALLARPEEEAWHDKPPLIVRAARVADGWRYSMDDESLRRVRTVLGPTWSPARSAAISNEVRSDFAALHGDALPHILPALVDLSAELALGFGGVRVVDEAGATIAEWPESVGPGRGYCLTCHRHYTLTPRDGGGFACSNCRSQQPNDGLWVAALGA